jgi:hypothetical protein
MRMTDALFAGMTREILPARIDVVSDAERRVVLQLF